MLLTLCALLFFLGLGDRDLWSSHEARAAQNAQLMLDTGDWGLPHLYDGQPDLQKPPGFYWLVAGVAWLRGGEVDAWAVRLPAALAALATALLVYGFLAARGRPVAGFVAAAVLASAEHFTGMARVGRIDMPLTCAITAALLAAVGGHATSQAAGRVGFISLALAAAVLLKGPVGIVLPAAVLIAFHLLERERFPWTIAVAFVLGAGLALPWFLWANAATDGEFFRVFFWYHNVQRALGGAPSLAAHPFWHYLPRFAVDFLPWTPLLVAAGVWAVRSGAWGCDREARFGMVWLVVMVGLLSCARFKRGDYLLPAYPGAALFVGCVAERWLREATPLRRRVLASAFATMLLGCAVGWWAFETYVSPQREAVRAQRPFAELIRDHAPAPETVLLFRAEAHLLAFHLGRPVHTLVEWGELNDLLARPGAHHFVTRAEFVPECLSQLAARRPEVVARSADVSPAPPLRPLVLLRVISP